MGLYVEHPWPLSLSLCFLFGPYPTAGRQHVATVIATSEDCTFTSLVSHLPLHHWMYIVCESVCTPLQAPFRALCLAVREQAHFLCLTLFGVA